MLYIMYPTLSYIHYVPKWIKHTNVNKKNHDHKIFYILLTVENMSSWCRKRLFINLALVTIVKFFYVFEKSWLCLIHVFQNVNRLLMFSSKSKLSRCKKNQIFWPQSRVCRQYFHYIDDLDIWPSLQVLEQ